MTVKGDEIIDGKPFVALLEEKEYCKEKPTH